MTAEQGNWPDRAVEMMAAMGRHMARQLRQLAPKPFGLVLDPGLSAFVGSHTQGVATKDAAGMRLKDAPSAITSMTLCYGTPEDPASPYTEVFTDFTGSHEDTVSLRYALGKAVSNENARLAGELEHGRARKPPPGPLERGQLAIVVERQPRTVRSQTYRDLHGLQFSQSGLLVTVIARGAWPDRPEFAVVTDLEPYLAVMEASDSEVIKARLQARYPNGPPRPDRSNNDRPPEPPPQATNGPHTRVVLGPSLTCSAGRAPEQRHDVGQLATRPVVLPTVSMPAVDGLDDHDQG